MEFAAARALARTLMAQHGVDPWWKFEFDNAPRRHGITRYGDELICLSMGFVRRNDEARVRQTILHEIAHALVGPGHGHDAVWKRKCREIGGTGERVSDAASAEWPWVGTCPNCGYTIGRHRLSAQARRFACSTCCDQFSGGKHDAKFLFSWERNAAA